ncbi:MAG: hypothetical protein SF182_30520 [Deltaproteobacteria bacterium]|nr:hypothetical protein [Deltaproteobacteria bacterium]
MRAETGRAARRLAGCLVVVWLLGCSSAPAVHVEAPLPAGTDPVLFVTAARQKAAIVAALRAAGFQVLDQPRADAYLTRVTVGIDQGARDCGTLNNVRFSIRRDQRTLVEVEAKGWTGGCQPNVFDAASRALRQRVLAMTGGAA